MGNPSIQVHGDGITMTSQPQGVSVTEPVSPAIECVKRVLFQPFDLAKWFVIGFCAWLADLGQRGGYPGTGGFSKGNWHTDSLHESLGEAKAWIGSNLFWLLPLVIFSLALGLALWVLFLWLSSRGKFMFLHCVSLNRAEVIVPWEKYAREANSLFWFRLLLGLCGLIAVLPLVVWGALLGLAMIQSEAAGPEAIFSLVIIGSGVFVLSCVLWIVGNLTRELVVPIQYLRGGGCVAAWRALLELLKANIGSFVLYLLFRIVLGLAIAVITLVVVLITCCTAGCILAIPYLGTVLLLPLVVFLRAYSAYFLAQFGTGWDVFAAAGQPTAGPG
jgi:hypothetical protein